MGRTIFCSSRRILQQHREAQVSELPTSINGLSPILVKLLNGWRICDANWTGWCLTKKDWRQRFFPTLLEPFPLDTILEHLCVKRLSAMPRHQMSLLSAPPMLLTFIATTALYQSTLLGKIHQNQKLLHLPLLASRETASSVRTTPSQALHPAHLVRKILRCIASLQICRLKLAPTDFTRFLRPEKRPSPQQSLCLLRL